MTRNLFQRDFTLARAGVLAALIFAGFLASGMSSSGHGAGDRLQSDAPVKAILLPAVIHIFQFDCDETKEGVQL